MLTTATACTYMYIQILFFHHDVSVNMHAQVVLACLLFSVVFCLAWRNPVPPIP